MNVANSTEVHGLERFLRTLDRRKNPERRTRGLITGSYSTTLHNLQLTVTFSLQSYMCVRTYCAQSNANATKR